MSQTPPKAVQNTSANNKFAPVVTVTRDINALSAWLEAYFQVEVATAASSRREQKRELNVNIPDGVLLWCYGWNAATFI